jgi:hypothetical protein
MTVSIDILTVERVEEEEKKKEEEMDKGQRNRRRGNPRVSQEKGANFQKLGQRMATESVTKRT